MNVHDFFVRTLEGEQLSLRAYQGKVMLIVNTATKCGLTSQFKGLEKLHQTYKKYGFVVLGFPCNQFLNQEPVSNEDMKETCDRNFGVTFPLFAKIHVNGANAHPLYNYLKKVKKGVWSAKIKWNFTKFLVDQNGNVMKRYGPNVAPEKLEADIKMLISGHVDI
ncbi:glutathione peroxidase [bacterium LRH843]|nr:glutathione peroxidase [bacterium LRH843]